VAALVAAAVGGLGALESLERGADREVSVRERFGRFVKGQVGLFS
jgi:hypothetical protein